MPISTVIREKRKELGLTQEQLGGQAWGDSFLRSTSGKREYLVRIFRYGHPLQGCWRQTSIPFFVSERKCPMKRLPGSAMRSQKRRRRKTEWRRPLSCAAGKCGNIRAVQS